MIKFYEKIKKCSCYIGGGGAGKANGKLTASTALFKIVPQNYGQKSLTENHKYFEDYD